MWDKNDSITCKLQMVGDNFTRAFWGVYGPYTRTDKLRMWDELQCVKNGWSGP